MAFKKNDISFFLIFALLSSAVTGLLIDPAKANGFPAPQTPIITIDGEGNITPQTDLISRNGNTYILTDDIEDYQINIECSNIVFDGDGHSITTVGSPAIWLGSASYVTIKNIEISTFYTAILAYSCSHCQIVDVKTSQYIELRESDYNTITNSTAQIFVKFESQNNLISRNNITNIELWATPNTFYQNNILLTNDSSSISDLTSSGNFWDNGSVGNYWIDYTTRYPNASEIDDSGLGDTAYVLNAGNIDHHPLVYLYNIKNNTITLPSQEPEIQVQSEAVLTAFVSAVSAIFIAIVAGCLFYYRKKHSSRPIRT